MFDAIIGCSSGRPPFMSFRRKVKNVVLLLLLNVVSLLVLLAHECRVTFFPRLLGLRIAVQLLHSLEGPPT